MTFFRPTSCVVSPLTSDILCVTSGGYPSLPAQVLPVGRGDGSDGQRVRRGGKPGGRLRSLPQVYDVSDVVHGGGGAI